MGGYHHETFERSHLNRLREKPVLQFLLSVETPELYLYAINTR